MTFQNVKIATHNTLTPNSNPKPGTQTLNPKTQPQTPQTPSPGPPTPGPQHRTPNPGPPNPDGPPAPRPPASGPPAPDPPALRPPNPGPPPPDLQNFALFFLSRPSLCFFEFPRFFVELQWSLCVFILKKVLKNTFWLSGHRVKPRRPSGKGQGLRVTQGSGCTSSRRAQTAPGLGYASPIEESKLVHALERVCGGVYICVYMCK